MLLNADAALADRLLRLIGNAGRDALFDRLASALGVGRESGARLLHEKEFGDLWVVFAAEPTRRSQLVARHLGHWYKNCQDAYWHDAHKGPQGGGFFGYWSVESAAVCRAAGVDLSSLRGLKYFPADL